MRGKSFTPSMPLPSRFRRGASPTPERASASSAGRAATTIEEKFADAAEVNRLTGVTPTLALHVLWDLPNGLADVAKIKALEKKTGVRAGSINPNLFQEQEYKYGSICNPSAEIREKAIAHLIDSVEIGKAVGSAEVSLWIADGSNYPGTQSMRRRIGWMKEALAAHPRRARPARPCWSSTSPSSPPSTTPTSPTGAWRWSWPARRPAGPRAGRHRPPLPGSTNIEQIVAWLLSQRARRLPLQRPQVRRRRPHPRLHRSLPGLPHLPRDPV
jgi:L-rhamnose isomerase/sugar isomerase